MRILQKSGHAVVEAGNGRENQGQKENVFSLIYISSAVKPFTQAELIEVLTKSREKNARLGITGMLLYKDGNFMQTLEGEENPVRELFKTISQDERHRGIITLLEGYQKERHFPDFSMEFHDLNSPEVLAMPGFSEFLNTPLTDTEFASGSSRCRKLLLKFKEIIR